MNLQLPNNYVSVEKNEMEYISGGDGEFTTAIEKLGTSLMAISSLAFAAGKEVTLTKNQSNAILVALGVTAMYGAIQLTTIQRIGWEKVKLHYTGKLYSGGPILG